MENDTSSNRYKFIDTPDAKGKPQHLHTLDGEPLCGTSTVLQILSKPLTYWASGLAMEQFGWTPINNPETRKKNDPNIRLIVAKEVRKEIERLTDAEYLERLDIGYKAHARKLDDSANAGIDMHAELETYVKWCINFNGGKPAEKTGEHLAVNIFAEWSMQNVTRFIASEVHCYSEALWTGGIVDLIYEDNMYGIGLLDFKSAKEAYDSHFLQNAGYDIALSENGIFDKDGNKQLNITWLDYDTCGVYSVFPFGMSNPTVVSRTNIVEHQIAFEHCVGLYKFLKPDQKKW